MKTKLANWANKICRRYGFHNWRTIWAYRICDWLI